MSAVPYNVIDFKLPKKPKVREKEPLPDQRKLAIIPIRAATDRSLTEGMLRTLLLIASYTNRAGITWVGQARLAQDLGVTRQAITKQVGKLVKAGYLEVVSKGFRGERANSIRLIFDPTIDAETAIAVTSRIEDTRPPHMRKEQQMQAEQPKDDFTEEQLAANRKRIKEMLSGMTAGNFRTHEPRRLGDILMPKKKATSSAHTQPSEVANDKPLHRQPDRQPPEVARTRKNDSSRLLIDKYLKGIKEDYLRLLTTSLSATELEETLQKLQDRCAAEGVPMPTDANLVEALLVLHADSL